MLLPSVAMYYQLLRLLIIINRLLHTHIMCVFTECSDIVRVVYATLC